MTLTIRNIHNEDLGIDKRHLTRWIGAVPFEYYRDTDGWHVTVPGQDKALVFPCAERLSAFWVGMALDFAGMEPDSAEDNSTARQYPEGY